MVQSADGQIVRWEEHLGPFASNFAVEFDPKSPSPQPVAGP